MSCPNRFASFAVVCALLLSAGCRRNLMRVETFPPGAQVYIEGEVMREEHRNRRLALKIDTKKEKNRNLNQKELEFQQKRRRIQRSPVEYEFPALECGYSLYAQLPGYKPAYKVEFLPLKWYEYPPLDLIVDLLPFRITDTRVVEMTLEPDTRPR